MSLYGDIVNNLYDYTTSTVSGTSAIPITDTIVMLSPSGASTGLTIAEGVTGQILVVVYAGGTAPVISVATVKTYSTSILLSTVGDYVILEFDGVEWVVKKLGRDATAS